MAKSTSDATAQPLLTIAELAKRFSLPESTARYYCKRFLEYLPHVGEGKRRRYRNEALAVFSRIVEEMKKSKNAMAVEATLAIAFPKTMDVSPATGGADADAGSGAVVPMASTAPAASFAPSQGGVDPARFITLMEQQTMAMQSIAESLTTLQKREARINELEQRLESRETELTSLQKELSSLRTLQGESEKLHQQDFEQLRKWLNRIAAGKQDS